MTIQQPSPTLPAYLRTLSPIDWAVLTEGYVHHLNPRHGWHASQIASQMEVSTIPVTRSMRRLYNLGLLYPREHSRPPRLTPRGLTEYLARPVGVTAWTFQAVSEGKSPLRFPKSRRR